MNTLLTTAVVAAAMLAAWHMWLSYKSGGFARRDDENWTLCPCGHGAGLHATFSDGRHDGGCRSGEGETNYMGYCKCPATRRDVIGAKADALNERYVR